VERPGRRFCLSYAVLNLSTSSFIVLHKTESHTHISTLELVSIFTSIIYEFLFCQCQWKVLASYEINKEGHEEDH
jgi:hypothetical protein